MPQKQAKILSCLPSLGQQAKESENKNQINIKNFGGTPPHLVWGPSHGCVPFAPWKCPFVPRTFCPKSVNLHGNQVRKS